MNSFKKVILLSYISVASAESAIITPAFPEIKAVFNVSTGTLDWLMTLFLIGYLLCQLFFGPVANRFGRLNCLRAGFILSIAGTALGLWAAKLHSFELLLCSRFITAFGAAVGLSGTLTMIREWMAPDEAKSALSYAVLSFMFGIGFGIYLGGLLTDHFNWVATLWLTLAYGIVIFCTTYLFKEQARAKQTLDLKTVLEGYVKALQSTKLIRYSLALGFVTGAGYAYCAAAPLIAQSFLHLDPHEYGAWNLIIMIGMFLGSLHSKYFSRKFGSQWVLLVSLTGLSVTLLICLAMFLFSLAWPILFFVFAASLYYFTAWGYASSSYLATEGLHDQGNANGMMSFINLGFTVVMLIVLGYLPVSVLWSFWITLLIGLVVAAGMVLWQLKRCSLID